MWDAYAKDPSSVMDWQTKLVYICRLCFVVDLAVRPVLVALSESINIPLFSNN